MLPNFSQVTAHVESDTAGTLEKMDKDVSDPESPATQATSGYPKGCRVLI